MGLRTWLVRRALGRWRITDDITRHLSTFQRLGEEIEVVPPADVVPIGARSVLRALRTSAATQVSPGWVWPYWLERQLDPSSPAFVPGGHVPLLTNVTARNWTAVGTVGSPWEAIVDPRGLVTPWFDGWSLDWWIGADDRWHLPSREVAVRQRLVGASPVVETAMRIPGGDAVHRSYGVRVGEEGGGQDLVVVEVENRSPVPVALAFAVRPANPEGLAVVERIDVHDGVSVTVDGRLAMLLPRPAARVAGSTLAQGDAAETVLGGRAGERFPDGLRCRAGLATAAFVYPLPHTASLRVLLPLAQPRRPARRRLARRADAGPRPPARPANVPSADQVARGWQVHADRGMRLVLPDSALSECIEANRRHLLLLHDGDEITPGPFTYHRFWFRDAAYLLGALDRYGYPSEVAEVLRSYPDRQQADGHFFSQGREWDSNGAAIHAVAEHWRLHRDRALVSSLAPAIGRGAEWIERTRQAGGRSRQPALRGLLPAGVSAEHLGPQDWFYWDDLWSLRGLLDAAELLAVAGEDQGAADAARMAEGLRADLDRSLALVAARLGTDAMPAGPRRRLDAGAIGSLAACWPLRLMAPNDPRVAATAELIRREHLQGDAFYQSISHTGLGTYLTLQLAFVELAAGDRRALDRFRWLLGAATPTWTWPEAVHPRLGGGCMGDGHHGWAAADVLSFARNLLVREVDDGLALCSLLPDDWYGSAIEVHEAPTHHGLLSFAVRWHGERPALLWELRPHPGAGGVRITAPGLDPAWATSDLSGEALLGPVPPPGTPVSISRS